MKEQNEDDEDAAVAEGDEDIAEDEDDIEKVGNIANNYERVCI